MAVMEEGGGGLPSLSDMSARKDKRAFICISSSSSSSDDDEPVDDTDDEDYHHDTDSDSDSDCEEINVGDHRTDDNDDSLSDKVTRLLNEGRDLETLSLRECKGYLRKHALRLRDGNAEALYPRSSFVINCTSDVCKGDVVLFTHKVYQKFDKMKRHGRVVGKRIVAGRVVKESYGAVRQQHTFTVEVLWSRGAKELSPLFPLLVKGRNLYKMRTFRQRWSNEAERSILLAEKHRRGGAARLVKAMKRSKKVTDRVGRRCQNQVYLPKPNNMQKNKELESGNCKRSASNNGSASHQPVPRSKQMNFQQNERRKSFQCSSKRQKAANSNIDGNRTPSLLSQSDQTCNLSEVEFHHRNTPFPYYSHPIGSTSTLLRKPTETVANTSVLPASQFPSFTNDNYRHNGFVDSFYNRELDIQNHLSGLNARRPFDHHTLGAETYGHTGGEQR